MKKLFIVFFLCFIAYSPAGAEIASKQYVTQETANKVDTSTNAKQTMMGEYTVTGTFKVPTQPLPAAE